MKKIHPLFTIAVSIIVTTAYAGGVEPQGHSPYQLPILNDPITHNDNRLIPPFTNKWARLLEQFYNTLGGHDDGAGCPVTLPTFHCEPFYWHDDGHPPDARDARHLRPHDIKAVIALGDSITAGFGMVSGRPPFATIWEYRGKVFSTGMDPDEPTVANFFRTYSLLEGGPEGVTLPMSRGKALNNAVSGAKTQDLNWEVDRLIHLLDSDQHYEHIRDDWKLITLFIGANNICVLCDPPMTGLPSMAEADVFEKNIRQVLTRLKTEASKSFVNLVGLFNVSSVYDAIQGESYCEYLWGTSHMTICSCVQGDEAQRHAADRLVVEYNARLEKLAKDPFFSAHDFHIVYQPGFTFFPFSSYNRSYLSGFDCFHPNECANEVMAKVLWNNMFSTPTEKQVPYDLDTFQMVCPGPDRPYLQ